MTTFRQWTWAALIAVSAAVAVSQRAEADIGGSRDHPLVGRYAGSQIVYYSANDYDEAWLLKAPMALNHPKEPGNPFWEQLEGRVTKIRYGIPAGRSSLEVLRNYEAALKGKGFQTLFACADLDCMRDGDRSDIHRIGAMVDHDNGNPVIYFDRARYVLTRLDRPQGPVFAAIFVGERQQQATAFVQVVEAKAMEGGQIVVMSASEMGDALTRSGKVDLYSILFDFDRAELKPESGETLDQIAALLREKPALRLAIIGHTDNQGSAPYNLDLSRRRAAAVVAALVATHRIAADRLTSSGEGFSRPVAPNDNEDGRARNRRVELVSR